MQKLAIDQIKAIFWLVRTLMKKDMTRHELNQVWLESEVSGGIDLNYQKLLRLRKQVDKLFGIIIDCDNWNRYHMINFTPDRRRVFMQCHRIAALGDVKPVTIEIEVYGSIEHFIDELQRAGNKIKVIKQEETVLLYKKR